MSSEMTWTEANDIVIEMVTGATTARLNHRQQQALRIVVGLLDRSRQVRGNQHQELVATQAERKRLRKALDDMRQERDRERKRADQAERRVKQRKGRPGCGKIPLGTAAEAHLFIQLRCAATGEHYSDYATYTCEQGCVPGNNMAGVWHIGHVVSRAKREQRALRLGIEDDADQRAWEQRWAALTPTEREHEIQLMDEHVAFWASGEAGGGL